MFDSSLSSVHFGPRTHWRLRLFVSVPWFLGLSGPPADALELAGVDQSWHIANFPNPKVRVYCAHLFF